EYSVGSGRGSDTRHELLDLVEDRVPALGPPGVISSRELDESRAGDVRGDVAPLHDVSVAILGPMHHNRGYADRRQDIPNVDVRIHLHEGERCAGARASTV